MAGRPGTLPWDMSTFTGNEPITRWSDNYNFLNNQINDSGIGFTSYAIDTGTVNNYVATLASPPIAYETGMNVALNVANTNTGASVINFNSLGNVAVVTSAGNPLLGGELTKSMMAFLVFDGTSFRVLNHGVAANIGPTGANPTVECAGCSRVMANVTFTGAGRVLTLNHLAQSVPVTIYIGNSVGSTVAFALGATQSNGTVFGAIWTVLAGGVGAPTNILNGAGSFTMANGQNRIFSGQALGNALFLT